MLRIFTPFVPLLFCWLTAALPSAAQTPAPRLSSSISARTIGAGQQAILSYQIIGSTGSVEEYPQTIEVAGLTIGFNGESRRMTLSNGATVSEVGFRYTVLAGEAGEFVIPPQVFRVDGVTLQGPAVTLTVGEAAPMNEEFSPNVQLTLGKTEFWKGEVVPVTVAVLVHPEVQPMNQFFPQIKTPNFAVNRFDRSAGLEAREINGEVWRAWQMESVMSALQSGAQEFGPAEFKAELMMPMDAGQRDPFGRRPGSRTTRQLTSNTVPVNVKELPLEGKPADFSGAVGIFEVVVEASPLELNAGDPIAVEIAVNGTGNFDAVTVPVMEVPEGWRMYAPRVSQENRAWGTEPGRKSFTQILIPEKNHTQIPPFVLHYFDPESGTYATKRSEPVNLTVKGEFKVAADGTAGAKDFAGAMDAIAPSEELGDILDQPLSGGKWLTAAVAPIPVNRTLLHGVPALFLGLLVAAGIRRRLHAARAARQPLPGAPREPYAVLEDLRRPGSPRRMFYQRVGEYLTSLEHHRQRQPRAGSELNAVLVARDRWLYGPGDTASSDAVPEAEQRHTLEVLSRI